MQKKKLFSEISPYRRNTHRRHAARTPLPFKRFLQPVLGCKVSLTPTAVGCKLPIQHDEEERREVRCFVGGKRLSKKTPATTHTHPNRTSVHTFRDQPPRRCPRASGSLAPAQTSRHRLAPHAESPYSRARASPVFRGCCLGAAGESKTRRRIRSRGRGFRKRSGHP